MRPGITLRALSPTGSEVASRMSPARIPMRKAQPTSARTRGVSNSTGRQSAARRHSHGAAFGVNRFHHRVENIFEAHQLRDRFLLRRVITSCGVPWATIRPRIEHNHALAQGEDFLAAVRHIKNRNSVDAIPLAQIVHDARLGRGVERRQRFVEEQHGGIGDQGSRQRDALALSAGNLARLRFAR